MTESSNVTDLIKVTSRLINVLEREVSLLRAMKPTELQDIQQDKASLVAAYESLVKSLSQRPEEMAAVGPAINDELKAVIAKFRKSLVTNENALRASKETSERVLRAIAGEIDKQRSENAGYSANGNKTTPRSASQTPTPIAVDKRL